MPISEEGSVPGQGRSVDNVEHLAWTAATALLQAQETGNRALQDYLLLLHYNRSESLETRDVDTLIDEAIVAHQEIIEDLECAREAIDGLGSRSVETPRSGTGTQD